MTHKFPAPQNPNADSLSVKLGGWFEAHATGKGVLVLPIVALAIVIGAALRFGLGS